MSWRHKGIIFKPEGKQCWSSSHAQVPSALVLADRIRLYYATRDEHGRSLTSFIEVDSNNPAKILDVHQMPVMELGEPGCHDEDGVMVGSILQVGEEVWMYYTGWSRCASVPYRVSCGLAISHDGGIHFSRKFKGPVLDRTPLEPHMTMSPYVIAAQGRWHMWYGSGTKWVKIDDRWEPIYLIKYADSNDGLSWRQANNLCIHPIHELEANTRPSVLATEQGLEMWFSYRHSINYREGDGGYRIGHAISRDGLQWERREDPAGLEPGSANWNTVMMAYPCVVQTGGRRIMFHNGDGFGSSGIAYSEWTP
jgi:hypothetical protein